ncbi:hypothetical protein SFRURICE_009359 [Spodoptera frugiperda]|nr:hypothetical protein SFRURICE_009359 [Spodoptera frugiperda]
MRYPEKWERPDVLRCVRWVARTFGVCAPRKHLLPDTGRALLALTEDNWVQVCDGSEQSARIYHAYLRHAHAGATGQPPPEPLPEHQATTSQAAAADYTMSQPYFAKCIIIVESTCTVYAGARLLQTGFLCFHIPVAGGRCGAARDSSRNADPSHPEPYFYGTLRHQATNLWRYLTSDRRQKSHIDYRRANQPIAWAETPPGMITSPGQRILLFLGNLVNFSLCSLKTLSLNLNFKPTWCSCTAVATVLRGAAQRPRRGAERYRPHLRVAPPSSERNTSARA